MPDAAPPDPVQGRPPVPPIVPDVTVVPPSVDPTGVAPTAALSTAEGTVAVSRSRRRAIVIVGIVAAGLGGLAILVGGGVALASLVADALGPHTPDQPLLAGPAAEPTAVSPLDCAAACFDETSVEAMTLSADTFARLGLTEATYPPGTYDPVTAGEMVRRDRQGWTSFDGDPDECFFAPTSAPYATTFAESDPESTDAIWFLGSYDDEAYIDSGDQSLRIFPDSATASAYLAGLADAMDLCDRIEIGPKDDRYSASVSAASAFSLPDEVAAVGWIREGLPGARWRAYIVDLQRGNVVVRIRILTDGLITERQVRNTVERYAAQLATVPPVTASVSP